MLPADSLDVTYDTGRFFPLTSLDFILDEPDIIQVILKSRLNALDEWTIQKSLNLFHLNTGATSGKKSPPITISTLLLFGD
ncbi:hypothetical protein FACS1894147_13140 [Spirochaetia bacterium]|nr:hypothetical protein FACS1894147_13140 [Spirochaetia bacterium]